VALRLGALTRAFRSDDARFAAVCTKALRGLEGGETVPPELLPMGARMLARGLLTARALSIGRDRPWPYAFVRQLDPEDPGFLPRSLLPVHFNLSYRNWTTIGLPGRDDEAIVDPGGWLSPMRDGPSLAVWVGDSRRLFTLGPLPGWGRDEGLALSQQRLDSYPMVRTIGVREEVEVEVDAFPAVVEGTLVFGLTARVRLRAPAPRPVRVGFAIRPANPEGIAPIFQLERRDDGWWYADDKPFAFFPHAGEDVAVSSWRSGDVYGRVGGVLRDEQTRHDQGGPRKVVQCPAGLATGVELYRVNLSPGETFKRTIYASGEARVGEALRRSSATRLMRGVRADWDGVTRSGARIELPAHHGNFQACRTTLLALTDTRQVTPGPLTYHAFWYRDAAYHLAALARLGYLRRAADVLQTYASRQARSGAWLSQGGEWDGTGQAIWTVLDHVRLSGNRRLLKDLYPHLVKAAGWIVRTQQDGLMPPGWSAEHLGPADRYYWDAIWACAGLREAAVAAQWMGKRDHERRFSIAHGEMLDKLRQRMGDGPVPAAPGRDMDSAAVSVLCAVWPLGVLGGSEPSMRSTCQWLLDHCMHEAGLFHDVVHSGVNPYLSAHLAQARLAGAESGAVACLDYLCEQASPTGCWPEAFHPERGGVMGDGDHAWAAAEFVMLARNLLVREEGGTLHLFNGTDRRWWSGETLVERLPTRFGPVRLMAGSGEVRLDGEWRERPGRVVLHKPGGEPGLLRVDGREVRGDQERLEL